MTIKDAWKRLKAVSGLTPATTSDQTVLDHYISSVPCDQNAIDAVPGWNHAFPPERGLKAGHAHLYNDNRILWCLEQAGSLEGQVVLELGPLEGMHTYMLAKTGARHVIGVEANTLAYFRCLVTKEVLKYENASFMLGDFVLWLENTAEHYGLIVASGVLYHSDDPVRLIELIAERSDSFFIWTHYYHDSLKNDQLRGVPFSGDVKKIEFKGDIFEIYERNYFKAWNDPKFCGGMRDRHYWMELSDILRVIDLLGFSSVTTDDDLNHVHGPAICIFARRR